MKRYKCRHPIVKGKDRNTETTQTHLLKMSLNTHTHITHMLKDELEHTNNTSVEDEPTGNSLTLLKR
ncbi:hypothetical protein BDD12DRAFT_835132 [Trichophaea hybrida]|nr:hypothetical protein BDD12DRAFT_835132 [Trichophaea hybrida]